MEILIFIPVYKRLEVTEICYKGVQRVQRILADENINSTVLIIGDEEEHKALAKLYNFNYVHIENLPIGRKHNLGVKHALDNYKFDYLLQMGSNNLLSNLYIRFVAASAKENINIAGARTFHVLNKKKTIISIFTTKAYNKVSGVGRLIKREVLENSYPIWEEEKNKGLDASSRHSFEEAGYTQLSIQKSSFPAIIDIKSDEDINPTVGRTARIKPYELIKHFPEMIDLNLQIKV